MNKNRQTTYNFSAEIWELFKEVGWYKGRNVKDSLEIPLVEYPNYPQFALNFLYEFGRLHVGKSGAGINVAKVSIDINPNKAKFENEKDGYFYHYSSLIKTQIYPLGILSDGYYLGVDEKEHIYCIEDYCTLIAENLEQGISDLLLGISNELIQLDEDTGKWLRNGLADFTHANS